MSRADAAGTELTAETRQVLLRLVIRPSRVVLVAVMVVVALLALIGLSLPLWIQAIPLIASLLLFGLPHGAVDHLVVGWLAGWPMTWRSIGPIVAVYLLLAGSYLALWAAMPVLAFGLFVALTWYHWGQGDLQTLLAVDGPGVLRTNLQRGLTLVVRGGLPMLVPLLVAPGIYRDVMDASTELFGPGSSGGDWVFDDRTRLVAGFAFAAIVVVTLVVTRPDAEPAHRRAWRMSVADTALLAITFAVVPPVLAIGIYFCCWHATRHIARVILLESPYLTITRSRWVVQALGRFAREAALPTVGALVLLAGLYLVAPAASDGPLGLTGLYLVGLAILTLPHTLVVTWQDVRQGVWRPPASMTTRTD